MTIMWIDFMGIKAYLVGGDLTIIKGFDGPPNPQYGFPQDALDFAGATSCGMVKMTGEDWTRLLKKNGVIA
jgi:hypothetical protein